MNPDEDQAVTAATSVGPTLQFSYHDKKIKAASDYAAKKEDDVQKLYNDVGRMGFLRQMWDSKVPNKNWRFYHCFTLSRINRQEVLAEIRKYIDFYNELQSVMDGMSGEAGPGGGEPDPHQIILKAYAKLKQLYSSAASGKECTGSSSVYELHRSFVAEHERLESMMAWVEVKVLTEDLKKTKEGYEKSIQSISVLTDDLKNLERKYDEMCGRFDRLLGLNETLLEQQTILMENNKRLEQQQEILLQENAAVRSILKHIANKGPNQAEQ